MRTSSEIDVISKRATKAAGFSWGVAEEVGKNIKNLELLSISGIENLNLYLKKIKGKVSKGPSEINSENKLDSDFFCPFYTGIILIDHANELAKLKNIKFEFVHFPILLIPFINRLSSTIGHKIEMKIDNHNIIMNLNSYVASDIDLRKKIIESAKIVEINILDNEDSFNPSVWKELYELSTETFVEESERLKANAAGAGLADND